VRREEEAKRPVYEGAAKRYEVRGKIVHSTDFVIWSNEPKWHFSVKNTVHKGNRAKSTTSMAIQRNPLLIRTKSQFSLARRHLPPETAGNHRYLPTSAAGGSSASRQARDWVQGRSRRPCTIPLYERGCGGNEQRGRPGLAVAANGIASTVPALDMAFTHAQL
jgi:hypothetical protein